MSVHGVLLAAGAGRRMGRPKALVRTGDGEPWLTRGVRTLRDGGCVGVDVVLGAAAEQALPLLDGVGAGVVVAADWAEGMSASLRAGLASATTTGAAAVVVSLVDLPDVGPEVVRRLLADPPGAATLRRAAYEGRPGHPVVLGRDHWAAIADRATGDAGARDYLRSHAVELVECGDLATGRDVDAPEGPASDANPRPTPDD